MTQIWAFNQATDPNVKKMVYDSIKNGKSRFGWSSEDKSNLKLGGNWTDNHARQWFLLDIKEGDWIVHINTPEWGRCIAGQVISEYDFDEGLQCDWGLDFRHNFSIDLETIIEFERNDFRVSPLVNLKPRQRYQRVYAVEDFIKSMDRLKNEPAELSNDTSREEYYLKEKTEKSLEEISTYIHETHKGKALEAFWAKVMRKIPSVVDVHENGAGWGTDYGADLIVTMQSGIGSFQFNQTIIVQIKSYEGQHYSLDAIEQIKTGIEKYGGTAGMIVSTGESTQKLEEEVAKASAEIDRSIMLLCGADVARFVVQNAPNLLFAFQL